MDHHEAAATDIAGARISDRERKADRDRGIDGVAALVEDLDADAGGALLLRHHHAVISEDRRRRRYRGSLRNRRDLGEGAGADQKRGERR